jgi:hypothetical protein
MNLGSFLHREYFQETLVKLGQPLHQAVCRYMSGSNQKRKRYAQHFHVLQSVAARCVTFKTRTFNMWNYYQTILRHVAGVRT